MVISINYVVFGVTLLTTGTIKDDECWWLGVYQIHIVPEGDIQIDISVLQEWKKEKKEDHVTSSKWHTSRFCRITISRYLTGRDRMPIDLHLCIYNQYLFPRTSVNSTHIRSEVYSMQHYVSESVSFLGSPVSYPLPQK